jgi:peptidoglycan/LPS O-acetylase OafA/YrhL
MKSNKPKRGRIDFRERIVSFDFLRAIAIISIVFSHMHFFIPGNGFWDITQGYFMLIGLGIFTFISGLLIDLNYSEKIKSFSDILVFYKKRAIRILPLNWIAIILFVSFTFLFVPALFPNFVVYYPKVNINILWVFSQFIGLQLLIQNFVSILWFVGFIVICYIIYPILIKFSKNVIHLIIISFLPLLVFGFLRLKFGMIDDRLFFYYMIFIGGIVTNKLNKNRNSYSHKKITLFLTMTVVFSFIYLWSGGQYYFFNIPSINFVIRQMLFFDIAIISGCIFLLLLLNRDRIYSLLEKCKSIITFLAISSYCVYLFHFLFFTIGAGFIEFFKLPAIVNDVLFYTLVIPITFVFSYYIQSKEKIIYEYSKRLLFVHSVKKKE